jgi:hypothetical protein
MSSGQKERPIMNTKMRNLTLTAAALAALTVIAPNASAQTRPHGGGNTPQHGTSSRNGGGAQNGAGHGSYGYGYRGGYGTHVVAPVHPYVRYGYGYGYGYGHPYRTYAGFPFYAAYPGPGYVYIANLGWALPPFFGAVWVPAHYDIGGVWVEGFWQ